MKSRRTIHAKPLFEHHQLRSIEENSIAPVLIVGMHNSGTSILAEILHKSGVFLGNNMSHYESYFFSVFINDQLIMRGDKSWAKWPMMSISEVMAYRDTIGSFVKNHWIADYLQNGYDGISRWGIKDPRLCVLLPLYMELFPGAKIIHIRRNPNDVAASLCQRTKHGVGKLDDFDHWRRLTLAYTERVVETAAGQENYHEIEYEAFCTRTEEHTRAVFKYLDLAFTDETAALLLKVSPARIGSYEKYRQKSSGRLASAGRRFLGKLK